MLGLLVRDSEKNQKKQKLFDNVFHSKQDCGIEGCGDHSLHAIIATAEAPSDTKQCQSTQKDWKPSVLGCPSKRRANKERRPVF